MHRKAKKPVAGEEEQEFPSVPSPPRVEFLDCDLLSGRCDPYKQRIHVPEEIAKSLRRAD